MKPKDNKAIANIILNKGKTESISSEIRNETMVSTIPTLIQYIVSILSQSNKAREEIKRIQIKRKKSSYPFLKII
jgi:hypothetical protein